MATRGGVEHARAAPEPRRRNDARRSLPRNDAAVDAHERRAARDRLRLRVLRRLVADRGGWWRDRRRDRSAAAAASRSRRCARTSTLISFATMPGRDPDGGRRLPQRDARRVRLRGARYESRRSPARSARCNDHARRRQHGRHASTVTLPGRRERCTPAPSAAPDLATMLALINLDSATERRRHMARNSPASAVPFERVGFDGRTRPAHEIDAWCRERFGNLTFDFDVLSGAEVGCWLSHLTAWDLLRGRPRETACTILEDDVLVAPGFAAAIRGPGTSLGVRCRLSGHVVAQRFASVAGRAQAACGCMRRWARSTTRGDTS